MREDIRKKETTPPGGVQASQELQESIDLAPSRGGVDDKVMTQEDGTLNSNGGERPGSIERGCG